MPQDNEPEQSKSERDGAEAEKVKRQGPAGPSDDTKPDEGLRPDQLTTENDGGGQG